MKRISLKKWYLGANFSTELKKFKSERNNKIW